MFRSVQKIWQVFGIPILVVIIVCLCFAFWSYHRLGDVSHGIAWLNGAKIVPVVSQVNIGEVEPGTEVEAFFRLKNLTNREILILGAESSCDCSVIDSLPMSIPPLTEITLPTNIPISPEDENSIVEKQIHLIFDIDHQPVYLKAVAKVRSIPKIMGEPTLASSIAE